MATRQVSLPDQAAAMSAGAPDSNVAHGERPSPRSLQALARLYARFGSAGLITATAVGACTAAALNTLVVTAVNLRYLHGTLDEAVKIVGIAMLALVPGLLIGVFAARDPIREGLSWSGEGRTAARAPHLWRTIIGVPRSVVTRVGVAAFVFELIPIAVGMWDVHAPGYVAAPMVLAVGVDIAAVCIFIMFGIELALRPLIADVAAYLPSDFEPQAPALALRTKAMVPVPAATVYAGLLVGALVDAGEGNAVRLSIAVGLALATAAVAVVMFLIATRSALDPIDRLIEATQRVRGGDFSQPVPLVTADELGTLAHSFNQMLDGLKEREVLREDLRHHAEELRESRARIVSASDAARRQVERDLHDGAQQHLVLLGLKLGMSRRLIERDPAAALAMQDELVSELDRALAELRDLAHGIYPAVLENEGLPGALREAIQRTAIPVTLECDGTGRYPAELEAAVYFCCLEALQNAAKHAGEGARATVRLDEADGELTFAVADNGDGFEPSAARTSAGVQNMTDRIGALGGALQIKSAPGRGTLISGTLPVTS